MVQSQWFRASFAAIVLFVSTVLVAQERPAEFYFGGKRIFVGMSQSDALRVFAECCKLSPPNISEEQRQNWKKTGRRLGQFILKKDSKVDFLGIVFFEDGRVVTVDRSLGDNAYNFWNRDVIAFARLIQRNLSPSSGDGAANIRLSSSHERMTGGETEILSLTFPNGRGIRLKLVTIDKAFEGDPPESREQALLEEFIE